MLPKDLGTGGQADMTPALVEQKRAMNVVQAQRDISPSADMLPEEDFSDRAVRSREHQADMRAAQLANYYYRQAAEYEDDNAPQQVRYGQPRQAPSSELYKAKAAAILAAANRRNKGALQNYPTLMTAVIQAAAAGTPIDEKDLLRLSNFAEVNMAADMYINAPDETRRKNIALSMNPVMRAAMFDIVGEKAAQYANTLETADQNVLVQVLGDAVGGVMAPLNWMNETAQHAFRAGLAATDTGNTAGNVAAGAALSLNPVTSAVNLASAAWANWDATERGQFDETYLNTLKASGKYRPVEVDVVAAIAKAQANGDPDPIATVMVTMGDVEGADEVIRRLIYRPEQTPGLVELARQVDSANLGSSGQMYFTHFTTADSERYSDYRGLRGREVGANAASVFYTFALDPTLAASKMVGAYRVAKYALTKLAPGKSAAEALASRTVGGVEMNASRRYIDKFTADLTRVDDLEKAGDRTAAAALRQQMSRQYREFPEDVVQEFRTQGVRTTDDFIRFVDDTNDTFLVAHGQPASWAAQLEKGIPAGYESSLSEVPLFERMYSAGDMGRRTPLLPRMSVGRRMRQQASRVIGARMMPKARSKAVIDQFYGTGSTEDVVQALDGPASTVTAIGKADQRLLGSGWQGRRVDGLTRLFASLPNKGQIYTGDARDAGVFYKFARSFLTKRHADLLTAAFRDANPGQRRLMVAGVIRTAAGARGVSLGKDDVLRLIDDLATGTREGELYSATQVTAAAGASKVDEYAAFAAAKNAIETDAASADYVFHVSSNIDDIVRDGLKAGDTSGVPLTEHGYGDVVHVFRKTDMAGANPKPVASFTYEQLGVTADKLQYGPRAQELGMFPGELGMDEAFDPAVEAATRKALNDAYAARLAADVESTIQYRPSNVDGQEHALHLWQTTEAVHIPSIRELESLKAYRGYVPDWLENLPQQATDVWSLFTLFGFRFAMRSAVEDLWSYAATAGRLPYLMSARRVSTGLRDARPNLEILRYKKTIGAHKAGDPILDEFGNVQIVVKSRLGMFAKRFRKVGDAADNGSSKASQYIGMMMLGNLDEQAILAAHKAAQAGNWGPTRELIGEALTRQRLTGLTPRDIEYFKDLANTSFGLKQMDELAETSRYINQGGYPIHTATDVPGVNDVLMPAKPGTVFGDFINVPNGDPNFGMFWFRNISGVVEHDGVIGRLAVANLEQPAMARRAVADAIEKDTTFGYKELFSALYTKSLTVDEFAQRYVDDVLHMFSGPDGTLNTRLLDRVAPVGDDGWRRVDLYEMVDGQRVAKLSPQSMGAYRHHGAPDYVLGQTAIPMPKDDTALLDRAWGWMGEQYARIAREPVFLANYREQRTILADYESELAAAIGPDAARAHTARMASDRAYGFTLSYVDNPTNRSQMAWKVRNVSRYYRATEDFYRRAWRMAKNYPEGFWKTALTYQVLDDTGFVFTDDQGDKYFAYPGNEFLQQAVHTVLTPLMGGGAMDIQPFMLGGKVKMLAPSSDPNQAMPQAMGPLAVWSTSMLFNLPIMRQFDGLERYITGEYAQNQSWYEVLIPAAVTRAMNGLSEDERQSMYGNAVMDAFAIAAANDMIPSTTEDGQPIESMDQLRMTPQWGAIERIARAGVITRMLMGYVVPASPQMYVNNVSDYARAHGVTSMRGAFLDLVKKKAADGSQNPVSDAFTEWWKLNPKGDLMPFTVSKTENTPGRINTLADVQANVGLRSWFKENRDLYEKYPNAALFLAPRDGEFSWGAWTMMTATLGLKSGKDFEAFVQDVQSSNSSAAHYATYADYQADIDKLDPNDPEQAKQISQLEKERAADLKWLRDQDPWWAKKYAETHNYGTQDQYAQIVYNQTKTMVNDLWDQGRNTPESDAIMSAIATYEDYMSDIKAVTGSTTAEDNQKRLWRQQLAADLETIAAGNENARAFIENVLNRTPDMQSEK